MRFGRDDSEFDRAIGFMDATFALALTLLVTTLDVDDIPAVWSDLGSLNEALGSPFVAFAISFAVIANFWPVHHRMIASFAAIDYPVIVANLGLIAAVVLLPFSTEAVGDPNTEDLALPTVVLAIDVAVASALCGLVYWLARKRDLARPDPERSGGKGESDREPGAGGRVPGLDPDRLPRLSRGRADLVAVAALVGRFMHPRGEQERKGR